MNTQMEVGAALIRRAAAFGYSTYAIGDLPSPGDPVPTPFLVHNWPEIWDRWYFERDYGPDDPVRMAAAVCAEPITVTEIKAGKAGFLPSAKGLEMLAAAAGIDRGDGLLVPIFGPNGYRGLVCLAGNGGDPDPRGRALLHLWSIYAHNRMRELQARSRPDDRQRALLTPREVAVLRRARNGLEDEAIARALAIRVRTVRFHFENARHKLGCRTRPEAVAMADKLHLLGG